MMMCIMVYVYIWPGVMVSDRRDWISLKFIWHMTGIIYMAHDWQQNTGIVQKGRLHANLDRSILV